MIKSAGAVRPLMPIRASKKMEPSTINVNRVTVKILDKDDLGAISAFCCGRIIRSHVNSQHTR